LSAVGDDAFGALVCAKLLWAIAQGWDDATVLRYSSAMAVLVVCTACGILHAPPTPLGGVFRQRTRQDTTLQMSVP